MRKLFLMLLLGGLLTGCQALEETANIMDYNKTEEVKDVQEIKKTISLDDNVEYIINTTISNHNDSTIKADNIIINLDETLKDKTNEIGYNVVIDLNNIVHMFGDELSVQRLTEEIANVLLDKLYYDYGNKYSSYFVNVNVENLEVALGSYSAKNRSVFLLIDELHSDYISYDIK